MRLNIWRKRRDSNPRSNSTLPVRLATECLKPDSATFPDAAPGERKKLLGRLVKLDSVTLPIVVLEPRYGIEPYQHALQARL